jgi:hypothetical protein
MPITIRHRMGLPSCMRCGGLALKISQSWPRFWWDEKDRTLWLLCISCHWEAKRST